MTMTMAETTAGPLAEAATWARRLGAYRAADTRRAIFEIVVTAVPFALIWAASLTAVMAGHSWIAVALVIPAALLLVRLFMIQHDCGHNAFFPTKGVNDAVGRVMGVLTLTPYAYWRHSHAVHHATSGNLDKRGVGDIDTLTTAEYLARSPWGRLKYRLYRHPVVMFGIGPFYLFLLQNRLPVGFMRRGWEPWASTMGTNLAVAVAAGLMMSLVGVGPFLQVHIPIVVVAATIGVWLFYVQHQFEDTHWDRPPDWTHDKAAIEGSSHYDLPPVLQWFTANIGIHHVHHLSSRIPFYRLPDVIRDHPELQGGQRLTIMESLRCVPLVLWDEKSRKLISFRELDTMRAA
jgi:omega-6 fatty acid desaturase (delta-12 desaturase)